MKILSKISLGLGLIFTLTTAHAEMAKSEKHAKKSTHLRQSVFSLLGSNMGPLGGMARGKIPFDAKRVEKHALRINQLSFMIADYSKTNTSKFTVDTEALNKIWQQPEKYTDSIAALNMSSKNLMTVAKTGSEADIKKAISKVGRSCGGCHDNFKKD